MTKFQRSPISLAVLLLAVSSLTLSACASKPERRGPPQDRQNGDRPKRNSGTFMQPIAGVFIAMDTNGDKVVTKDEVDAGTKSEWSTFTRNPSAAYFTAWSQSNLGSTDAMPTFMGFDRDFNGVISESEFSEQLENTFERMDKNSDGRLERSEMLIVFDAPQGQRSRQSGEKSEKGGRGNRSGGGRGGGGGRQ